MTKMVEYLVLQGRESEAPAPAALAAEFGLGGRELMDLVEAARVGGDRSEAVRLVLPAPGGPRTLVVVALPEERSGPGSPSDAERFLEAGLRLGAAAPRQPGADRDGSRSGGRIWWAIGDPPGGGDPASAGSAPLREALWRGIRLGAQHAGSRGGGSADPGFEPRFSDGAEVSEGARHRAEAVAWVRSLVERPANLLGPAELAAEIAGFAERSGRGISVETWTLDEAVSRGFGAVAAVGGSSARPPLVLRMRWAIDPTEGSRMLGLVGKGITFDSGGIDIKRDPGELAWMKSDMAAAAAVAAAVVLASRRGGPGPCGVEAILPLCDNVVSGSSVRPGDVVEHPGGRTSEVVDTDSEGRLVLADGIAWFREQGFGAVIDAGTLSDGGAGLRRSGLWSNDAGFAAALAAMGEEAVDPLWILPLPYGEQGALSSRTAQSANAPLDRPDAGRHAALYLSAFVEGMQWAHIDIGGTAYLEHAVAGWPEGATGASTLALAEAILRWSNGDSY